MTEEEINETIAKYMGIKELAIYYPEDDRWSGGNSVEYTYQKCENYKKLGVNCEVKERVIVTEDYTKSLDVLVPVVEKLFYKDTLVGVEFDSGDWFCYHHEKGHSEPFKSPSIALATACAKAIKELDD